ncbi:MAG: hypothetical protein JXN61_09730 [Sedimentisphaerales bacterium]|nr:hypothetical protein [Sedimentisphaerales bacterium]
MLLWVFRAIFWVIVISLLFVNVSSTEISGAAGSVNFVAVLVSGLGMAIFVFLLDVLTPKRKLAALAGVFFGLLVGMLISIVLAAVVDMVSDSYKIELIPQTARAIKWVLGVCMCYLTISVVMRTKDDVRFVIPYVEFAKQTKGARPLVLDTSVIIDGRIVDLCRSKLFDAPLVVPRFVLNELQFIADSADKLKRQRGRRGLDILNEMQSDPKIDIEIDDTTIEDIEDAKGVDQKLMVFTRDRNGRLATTDYNLSKVAQVREVDVVNINDLASALKVIALPGEAMQVKVIKPGEEADQGIGYLDDGTMVVVEGGRNKIGRDLLISITSSLQTSAGKMIFGKFEGYAQDDSSESTPNGSGRRRSSFRRPTGNGARRRQ